MTRLALTLAAGMMLGGFGLGATAASAAPAMPQAGIVAGSTVDTVAMHHRRHYRSHHSTRGERRMRRMNTMRHGDPNARNPERPGYKQQLGNTTGGPRY
ncbi:hypothetical protein [Methylobacterium trifolii]|uniref:Uncharacterized protein n=1 Tax=Methylobacterium trifolii TaxID=1003092 RepID=A0ABQ4TZN1_9HYPH|nr:hypothetical protein [Methylobacterium trifolii]GJE60661.1 hypothetical protein MPOCJGCO_2775 [Methylobacterium trifolii]